MQREEEAKREYRRPTCLPIALLNEVEEEDEDEENEEEEAGAEQEKEEDGPQESKKMKKEVMSDEDWEMI